ncbi:MAG: hypothetical protein GY801_17620 [bacterium]|nr:hypothetical protein [bacterium]
MIVSQKLVTQYTSLKATGPDCLLLMQVRVFLQVMDEDARAVSQVTGLKLQMGGDIDIVCKDASTCLLSPCNRSYRLPGRS